MTRPARVDAWDKVTGRTVYVDDVRDGAPLIALAVTSRIAKGRIGAIQTAGALKLPGVVAVMTHQNAPRLRRILAASMAEVGTIRPLQDDCIRYAGQAVAVVIARDWQAAREGAAALEIDEIPDRSPVAARLAEAGTRLAAVRQVGIAPGRLPKGRADRDIGQSPHVVDAEFHCAPPRQHPRIYAVGLGQSPDGLCEASGLPRIDFDEAYTRKTQVPLQAPVICTGGLKHEQNAVVLPNPVAQLNETLRRIGQGALLLTGVPKSVQTVF